LCHKSGRGVQIEVMPELDVQRFEAIFDDHSAAIFAYLLRRVERSAAEDALSDTFLIAWRRRVDLPHEPRAWLYAIARNVLLNQRRVDGRRAALVQRLARDRSSAVATDTAEDGPLIAALRTLPLPDREVLLLHAWEHLSSAEAGLVLGCTPEAYRARLARAKQRLRTAVAEGAGDDAVAQTQAVEAR
jgi:RNA polymerase sigma-70 factor, ECF subfamily